MINTQLKKVGIVFGAIIALCLLYSIVYKRGYEPFADVSGLPMKTCKANSDCPSDFICKDAKCVFNRPN
jgi:hypothetical protein